MPSRISLLLSVLLVLSVGCGQESTATPTATPTSTPKATPSDATSTPTPTPTATPVVATPTSLVPLVVLEGTEFTVELAATPQERAMGLMYRSSLEREHGMLFIYDADGEPGFWMLNMIIPLDIVWIDAQGVVAGVSANVPPAPDWRSPPMYHPPRPIRYVLEINAGLAAVLGISPGSVATFVGIPPRG